MRTRYSKALLPRSNKCDGRWQPHHLCSSRQEGCGAHALPRSWGHALNYTARTAVNTSQRPFNFIAQRQRRRQPRRNLTSPAIDTERVRVKHPIRGGRCPRPPPRPRPSPRPIAVDVEKNLSNAVDEEIEIEARGGGAATGARLGDAPQEHRREGGACARQPQLAAERSMLSFSPFCDSEPLRRRVLH